MAVRGGPRFGIVQDGLVLNLDASNALSYPGTGTDWFDLAENNDGTLLNSPTFNSSNGGSIVFDGIDDYSEITTTNISDTTELTCNCWVKTSDITADGGSYRAFFATGPWQSGVTNAWKLAVNSNSGKIDVWANAASKLLSGTALPIGEFVNVTYTYGSNTGKIYFNGSLSNSGTYTLTHYMGKIYLGAGGSQISTLTTAGMWNGNISSAQFYNRALSANEVLQNYNATKTRFGI